jgi:FKBP-type peptidyl-prolyl cis-trans isomerase FklB
MKIKQLLVLIASVAIVSCGRSYVTGTKIKNENDSLSYAYGINIYNQLMQDSIKLNPEAIAKGMIEAESGKASMDYDDARSYIYGFLSKRDQARMEKEAEANRIIYKDLIQQGDSFLQANKDKPGVITTPSGLQYKVIKMGTGNKPVISDRVKVDYIGTLIDGTKFDSSYDRGTPAEFQVGGVIKGWVEALQLMPVGSKFVLYIPENLAYGGNGGGGGLIKPYSTLIFEVELLSIVKN